MLPILLKLGIWLMGMSAGAALALVRTVHTALRDSVLWFEQVHCVHVLELGEGKLLYGHNRRWNVLSPLGNV